MSNQPWTLVLATVAGLTWAAAPAAAGGKAKAAQEVAEQVLRTFGREAAKDGAQALARRIETAAVAHGDEVFQAVRLVGPRGLHLIENAGTHSKEVARLLATHGERGAVFVASKPQAMQLVLRHGEAAAAALVKTRGVAAPVIEQFGQPAVRALNAVGAQNGRRLAMLADSGELAKIARSPEILDVIARYGNPACDFVWRNKGALTITAVAAAFLADPQPFIDGAKDLTKVVAENAVKPLAEVPATVAREAAGEIAKSTNWSLVFSLGVLALGGLALFRLRLQARLGNRSASCTSTEGEKPCR